MENPQLFKTKPDMIKTVAAKYARTEKSLNEDVQGLKTWMTTQPHLPEILDDKIIQNFLILNKCSIERAKRSIDMYYTLRSKLPEFYEDSNPKCKRMRKAIDIQSCVPVSNLTEDMYRILIYKVSKKNLLHTLEHADVVTLAINLQEVRLRADVFFGDLVVYDMEGIDFGFWKKMLPTHIIKAFAVSEKIFSLPMKGIYMINCPSFMNAFMNVVKTVVKPKIFNRIHLCTDASILAEAFPKELLPSDYGGDEKSVDELNELMKIKLRQHQDRFDRLDELKVDERLRPEKLENDDVLGFHGNFKMLDVD